jgi:hypothetical protein
MSAAIPVAVTRVLRAGGSRMIGSSATAAAIISINAIAGSRNRV